MRPAKTTRRVLGEREPAHSLDGQCKRLEIGAGQTTDAGADIMNQKVQIPGAD
jgi:hypothetical protein